MKRLPKNNKGQFAIVAAILIAVLSFSLAFSVHQTNSQRQELRYVPVQELVLGITSDLERSLDYAINVSSHIYDITRDKNASIVSGSNFMATWTRSVLTAYANAALNVTVLPNSTDFNFNWDSLTGTSYGSTYLSLDAPSYGFQGWIGHSQRSVVLTLYPLEHGNNQHTRNETDRLEFCLTQSKGQGNLPIPNLEIKDLTIQNHITGSAWNVAQIEELTYLGGGNYSVTFSPGLNPISLGVVLSVSTPDEGILVEAKNYEGYGNTLYVDYGYVLATDPQLSDKWYKGGQGDHLPSTASTGYNKQEAVMRSYPTTVVYIMSYATITAYVRPTPPSSAKTLSMEFGFFYDGQYYGLGTGSYPVNAQGMYPLTVSVIDGNWTSEYGPGVIPIGSTIQLKMVVEFTTDNGFFFILYGVDQESRIEFS